MNRSQEAATPDHRRRIVVFVAALTLIGAFLRGWSLGRLGLTHFDEGIYAMAASWAIDPGGLATLSPTLIPYAPPGFTILVGILYGVLGPSDLAAIAASLIVGTATIPVVAWLAGRTFGPAAGLVAAALVTFSGPHIAFSRMALTDASFLLAWLIAIGAGQRFLERPGALGGVLMGLAVGVAQTFKYNGWLAGGIIAASVPVGILMRQEDRTISQWGRSIGWGLLGAMVAAVVVWPWYGFVERNGGYDSLLRHQRSYLGGISAWGPNLRTQLEQAIALSGVWGMRLAPWAVILIGLRFIQPTLGGQPFRARVTRWTMLLVAGLGFTLIVNAPWWIVLVMLPLLVRSPAPAVRVVGVAWVVFSILSPFYHPYARLWLPLHAIGWIATGGLIAGLAGPIRPGSANPGPVVEGSANVAVASRIWLAWGIIATVICVGGDLMTTYRARPLGGLLGPSDSLRLAVGSLARQIPDDVPALKLLARPPVTFYLAGKVAVAPQEGLESMARSSDPRMWALYDEGLGLAPRPSTNLPSILLENWDVVSTEPTTLSLPTLLDLDPAAARGEAEAEGLRTARLWLLRPRRAGGGR